MTTTPGPTLDDAAYLRQMAQGECKSNSDRLRAIVDRIEADVRAKATAQSTPDVEAMREAFEVWADAHLIGHFRSIARSAWQAALAARPAAQPEQPATTEREAFENRYRLDANDPSTAEELRLYSDGWNDCLASRPAQTRAVIAERYADGSGATGYSGTRDPQPPTDEVL